MNLQFGEEIDRKAFSKVLGPLKWVRETVKLDLHKMAQTSKRIKLTTAMVTAHVSDPDLTAQGLATDRDNRDSRNVEELVLGLTGDAGSQTGKGL